MPQTASLFSTCFPLSSSFSFAFYLLFFPPFTSLDLGARRCILGALHGVGRYTHTHTHGMLVLRSWEFILGLGNERL